MTVLYLVFAANLMESVSVLKTYQVHLSVGTFYTIKNEVNS